MLWDLIQSFQHHEQQRAISRLNEEIGSQDRRDNDQDARIRFLEHENRQLELAVAQLLEILRKKEILDRNDLGQIEELLNQVLTPDAASVSNSQTDR